MMLITFISDTHTYHDNFTDKLLGGDTIVFSGDMSSRGYSHEVEEFLEWFNKLNYTNKIMIAGNHDFFFENKRTSAMEMLTKFPNITYLENSEIVIDGIKFWGSPYTPRFFDWAFNVDRGKKIREHWLLIPHDTDILITHGPPMKILDFTIRDRKHVGCEDLNNIIMSQLNIKVHAFGHIHEGYGIEVIENKKFINASLLNHRYECVNSPIIVDI